MNSTSTETLKMSDLYRIPSSKLRLGESVEFDCFDAVGRLMFKKGQIIATEKLLERMIERGVYSHKLEEDEEKTAGDPPNSPFNQLELIKNTLSSLFFCTAAQQEVEDQSETINFAAHILKIVESLQLLCETAEDEVIGAIHLYPVTHYTPIQPLRRAILCELIGLCKGIPVEERRIILAAALTCDLSIYDLQEELHNQRSPVTLEQKKLIEEHPENSVVLLKALGVEDAIWLTTILQHHERLSGMGYPRQLKGDDIILQAKLLALADIYAAMVTPRAYRSALPREAMRDIFMKRGTEVDEEFTVLFIKKMGIYPPGSFVKLQNGETAIVIKRTAKPSSLFVKSVVGPRGAPLEKLLKRNTGEFPILDAVERNPIVMIDLHKLWDY